MIKSWNGFWFAEAPTSSLALVRIAFGLIVLAWTLSLAPSLFDFFSSNGIVPRQPAGGAPGVWGLLDGAPGDTMVVLVFLALLVGAACLTVGYHTKIASAIVFVGLVSLTRRNPFIFNAGDGLLRVISFYLLLSPAGASLSLDRWRRAPQRFWEFARRPIWPLRLMQIQLSIVYIAAVWEKVRGETWNDGTAVSYALRFSDHARFPVPDLLTSSPLLVNLATYGTLAFELAVGVLVWNRKARPWVMALGVLFHLSTAYSIRVGFLTVAILALYLSFFPADATSARLLALRDRLEQSVRIPEWLKFWQAGATERPVGHGREKQLVSSKTSSVNGSAREGSEVVP